MGAQLHLFIDEWSPYCLPALAVPPAGAAASGAEAACACSVLQHHAALKTCSSVWGPCGAWPCRAPSCQGGSASSRPGRVLGAMVGSGPAATLGTPAWLQQHCGGLKSHCSLSPSRCPHRLLAHEMGTLVGTGWREAGVRLCNHPGRVGGYWQGRAVHETLVPKHPPDATFVPRCGWQGQARPHTSRSWTQNSSRAERVSLSKVSQGWLPPWCRSPSSHSPNLPLGRCQRHDQPGVPSPASSMPGHLPVPTPGCPPAKDTRHKGQVKWG